MLDNIPHTIKTKHKDHDAVIGALIIATITSLSLGIGYLTSPGWGWITLAIGCGFLAIAGIIYEDKS